MLSKIKIYGDLADFIGHKELEAVINSSADAIRFLVTNFKGLESYMSDKHYKVLVNSTEINQDELHNPVGCSEVSVVPVISDIMYGVAKNAASLFSFPPPLN